MKKIAGPVCFMALVIGMALLAGGSGGWRTHALPVLTGGQASLAAKGANPVASSASVLERQPLQFIENRGQADARARYILRGSGQTVYLTDNGLLFDFLRFESEAPTTSRGILKERKARRLVVGLDLVGSSPHPQLAASDPRAARFHYLIGNDRSKWVSDAPAYGEVLYRDVYPAVDLRVYDDRGTLRYDFIVRPGGRVEDIRLAVRGADGLRLDEGRLVADTAFGGLAQSEPVVYQEGPAGRETVPGSFALAGGGEYGFAVGAHDASRALVIDPAVLTLGYSSFLGGGGEDVAYDVKWDGTHYYVTGKTNSAGFPVTAGAYDTVIGNTDAFVAKIDPAASGAASLVWCTFIGGSGADTANGIDVLGARAYIVGTTYSSDFPQVNAGFMTFNDGSDAFVCQLDGSGASLDHSVCVGAPAIDPGDRYDTGNDISVFMTHAIWICGSTTYGPSFYYNTDGSHVEHGTLNSPLTSGDAFMLQVNFSDAASASPGVSMVFGGQYWDEAKAISEDGSRIYLTGYTESGNFPVSAGAFQSSYQGGRDAFVFKTDFGGSLVYSTFLGSSDQDMGTGIDIGAGGAYVCGYSWGDMPVTANGYDTVRTHGTGVSGFLARVNEGGGSLGYATYIETEYSGQNTYAYGIATSGLSNYDCWVTGTASSYMLGTLGEYSKNYYQQFQGGKDVFAARFDTLASGGDSCLFMTNLGGTAFASDETGFAIDGHLGTAVVAGSSECNDFPVSASAYDSSHNGGADAFVATLIEPALAVTTDGATEYSSSAILHSTLFSKAGAASVLMRFEYGTASGALGSNTAWNGVSGSVPYHYSATLTGLTPGTTYYYRAVVQNYYLYGTSYGAEKSFTTPVAAGPTVTTTAASAVTATTASSGGNVTTMGSDPVTARGVCWSTSSNPTTADSHTSDGTGTGSFTSSLTGLNPGMTYHVRAYASNAAGTAYGNEVTFTTQQPPTVTTQAVTAIAATTATANGNITSLGVPDPTAHGVCWDTAGTPTTAGSHTDNGAASATGAFTSSMTGLAAYTTYFVRAYATNSAGTAYGNEVSFTTGGIAPAVTTQPVTAVAATTATGNGNITSLGVPNPTAHGVCWNTTGTPTTAGSHADNGAASATGAFTSSMTGLAANSTYHVRAYATNAAGTSYGSEVMFTTVPAAPVATAASNMTGTSFQANWDAAAGATGYRLDVALDSWFTSFVAGYNDLEVGNVTLHTVTGLASGTTYYYRVRAVNASGASADSNWIEVITVPGDPLALAATAVTATGFQANWNAVSGAGDYYLDVAQDSGFTVFVPGFHDRDIGLTSYPVTGLAPGTLYYYRVRAYNSSGISGYSNVITVLTVPPAPVALAASAITVSAFQANWQAALAATGYRLDVSTVNTFATCVAGYKNLEVGNVLSHSVSGLTPGTTYYYRVRATNGSGSSADSNVIQLATLAVHTMRFISTAGGSLAGKLTQIVDHGGDCTPVRADPAAGYRFVEWSGVGSSFHSIGNPLTVRNVQEDMTLRATFTNAAPLVRIVAPDDGATVWGPVAIRAEVSDDLAVSSVEFYVDGVEPVGGNAMAPVASSEAPLVDSGDLLADFRGADALLLDGQRRLRKTSFQGGWQPVIVGDFALRDVALTGTRKVHLIFVEPLRLADGVAYSWVCCDLETGEAVGIAGTPVSLPRAPGSPLVQFDAAGNGYYFAADAAGVPALWQRPDDGGDGRARELTRNLKALSGQQVRQWLALPDGSVLLELWRPETARSSRVRILPGGGNAIRVEGDFGSALGMAAEPVAAAALIKAQGEQLLAVANGSLAVGEWPSMNWQGYASGGQQVVDLALSRDGGLFFIGSDPGDGLSALWSAGSGGCRRLVPLPQPCLRLAVLGAAPGEQADEAACGGLVVGAGSVFSQDWSTLAYANGQHAVSVLARDAAGSAARDDITVTVANAGLSLAGERFSDHAWLVRKEYVRLRLTVENTAGAPVAKYVIYRRSGGGTAETAGEFLPSEVQNGSCELIEPYAGGVTYWALALSAEGAVIGASAEITI